MQWNSGWCCLVGCTWICEPFKVTSGRRWLVSMLCHSSKYKIGICHCGLHESACLSCSSGWLEFLFCSLGGKCEVPGLNTVLLWDLNKIKSPCGSLITFQGYWVAFPENLWWSVSKCIPGCRTALVEAARNVLCALYFRAALEVWEFKKKAQSFLGDLPLVKLSVFCSGNSSAESQSFAVRLNKTAQLCLQP